MKCDELKPYLVGYERQYYVYDATSVEEAIAELKSEIRRKEAVEQRWFERCMEARSEAIRLKRALWIARAERAKDRQQLFHFSLDYEKLCIDGFYDPYSGRRELSPKQWIKVFNKVEIKCLKKVEGYK